MSRPYTYPVQCLHCYKQFNPDRNISAIETDDGYYCDEYCEDDAKEERLERQQEMYTKPTGEK